MARRLFFSHVKNLQKQIVQSWNGGPVVSSGTQLFLFFCSIFLTLGLPSSPSPHGPRWLLESQLPYPYSRQEAERRGQRETNKQKFLLASLWTVLLLRELYLRPVQQPLLRSDWPAHSIMATLAAREAGNFSHCLGYVAAPINIKVLVLRKTERMSRVGSWQAWPLQALELLPP